MLDTGYWIDRNRQSIKFQIIKYPETGIQNPLKGVRP